MIVFAALEMLTSCSRTKYCPGFSYTRFEAWFPYTEGQQLTFMNARQEKDSIIIYWYERSGAKELKMGWHEPSCSMEAAIHGSGNIPLYIYCNIDEDRKYMGMSIADFGVMGVSLGDTGLVVDSIAVNPRYKSTYHSSLNLNGKTYSSVQLFEKDTTGISTEGLCRVYLCKENGIIAYEKYPSHELWVKQ